MVLPGGGGHPRRLLVVDRERLLAEHVLSCTEVEQRVVAVAAVRRADVHDVDVVVVRQGFVRAVAMRDLVLEGEAIGALLRAGPDRDDLGVGEPGRVPG